LAQLIGRLLARHWLSQRRQTDLSPQTAQNSSHAVPDEQV